MNKRNIIAVAIVAAFISTGAQAADPTTKCLASKLKEVGKLSSCLLKADAKGELKNLPSDRTKCDEKFAAKWDKIEAKAGPEVCVTEGDSTALQASVAQDAADTYEALNPPPTKLVFVTSGVYTGDLGGVAGADQKCADHALAASLPGEYRAWLGRVETGSSPEYTPADPESGWTHSASPYVRVDGVVVAENWADLTDGSFLAAPIALTELGDAPSGTAYAWSNLNSYGAIDRSQYFDCNGWNEGFSTYGNVGFYSYGTYQWAYGAIAACYSQAHLYCFEQ